MARRVRRAVRWVRWYLRELTDESAYERYLDHQRRHGGITPATLSRRDFERRRTDRQDHDPSAGFRCC